MALAIGFAHQFEQMVVVNRLDLIRENHEAAVDFIELPAFEVITKLFATQTQRMPPRMLTQYQFRVRHTYRLRRHDFVRQAILEHAILMNAGLVRESIASDDGFVRLHRNTSDFLEQLVGGIQLFSDNAGLKWIAISAHSKRHYNFFERRIPCTFADA